ncbi:something about silencing, SAS, complex subunit 4-domain-containing protein [Cercophora newfieldiana]|uniref:Something about silencing, SAS, complex subunit 4-domain-containing protein n=1 Tax=Cercophora newfieldiana TaxID=92897 RepID=A0AA39YRZ5_9PEZI|nr:something about silencing, SAS, complex subunit 4-domain-containing protein [Cercophora newfieldiana]
MAMTTSLTRSRRAEGLHHQSHPNPRHHQQQQLAANARAARNNQNFSVNFQRTKRSLEGSVRDFDPVIVKKARFTTGIAVEIPSRSSFHSRTAREAVDAKKAAPPPPPPPTVSHHQPTARPAAVAGAPNGAPHPSRAPAPAPTVAKPTTSTRGAQQQQSAPTRHKEKVGKHELSELQPSSVDTKSQGRKLRSQEASRFKSELSAYFPDYDEVIGNEPKETHILGLDTPIIVDVVNNPSSSDTTSANLQLQATSTRSYSDSLFTDLWDSQRIDFSFLTSKNNKSLEDPLPDSVFEPAHKKSERLERSIRNTEKGRAQHEKDQIIRLLDGLQGPDWLRVMGVSGITESRKKTFEPAREHFIKGCQAILEKFRSWAAEEKRRKLEKERAIAEAEAEAKREAALEEDEEEEEEEDVAENMEEDDDTKREIPDSDEEMEDIDDVLGAKDADPPDESDVEASIAKQLREEALAAAKTKSRRGRRTVTPALAPPAPPARKPEVHKEFTSFFQKHPHLRETALNKSRRRGRNVWAWGHPVPEPENAEFQLPQEFVTEDTLKSRARGKRRSKRKHVS